MKRSELYDRVWTMPVAKIADEVGIAGTRIAAICRHHRIPTPPRGYWAKLSAGKQPVRILLPQPESDYDKVGKPAARPDPSAWVAPGVLLRAGAVQPPREPPPPAPGQMPADRPETPCPAEVSRAAPPLARPEPKPGVARVDLELVRAAAVELQGMQAIRELLRAVSARAVHAPVGDARRILDWAAAVREQLEAQDPVAAVLRLAAEPPRGREGGP